MGGRGSGRRSKGERKVTVNESLTIGIKEYAHLLDGNHQVLCCKEWGGYPFVFQVTTLSTAPNAITIHFFPRLRRPKGTVQRILVEEKKTGICGQKWFNCPFVYSDGIACGKRVAKLHLPPKETKFGCRDCHDLRYASSQKAHKAERKAKANSHLLRLPQKAGKFD